MVSRKLRDRKKGLAQIARQEKRSRKVLNPPVPNLCAWHAFESVRLACLCAWHAFESVFLPLAS
eukprot:2561039-Heterocapsa_arctica.AAC.1